MKVQATKDTNMDLGNMMAQMLDSMKLMANRLDTLEGKKKTTLPVIKQNEDREERADDNEDF
jgi:hypothetical protein